MTLLSTGLTENHLRVAVKLLYTRDFTTVLHQADVFETISLASAADYLGFKELHQQACDHACRKVTDENASQVMDFLSRSSASRDPRTDDLIACCRQRIEPGESNFWTRDQLLISAHYSIWNNNWDVCVCELEQNYVLGKDVVNLEIFKQLVMEYSREPVNRLYADSNYEIPRHYVAMLRLFAKYHPDEVLCCAFCVVHSQ